MTVRKCRFSAEVLCIAAMLGASACSQPEDKAPALSGEEIAFRLSEEWTPMMPSRAAMFDEKSALLDPAEGGGNFTLYAHVDGSDYTYIGGARVWYFDDPQVRRWIFWDGDNSPISYYWPNSGALNFFAFMPDVRYNAAQYGDYSYKPTCVTIGPYSEAAGQTFSCDLPTEAAYNSDMQEFIYAYEEGLTKEDNPVTLHFKHPFATVNFKVAGGSYRLTVENIKLSGIYVEGTFSTVTGKWKPKSSSSTQDFTMNINKRIPNDVNYNTLFDKDEPFLVMPQSLENASITLTARRSLDDTPEESISKTVALKDILGLGGEPVNPEWLPGRQYVYTIKIGNNKEEIYFNVAVCDWVDGGKQQDIDVE